MIFDLLYSSASLYIWIIAGIHLLALFIQLLILLRNYIKVIRNKDRGLKRKKIGISVIICAKNEAENLAKNLPVFLQQDYPEYEVIVVNDCSSDHTEEVLMELRANYPHLRYTSIQEDVKFTHGKKLAVTVGIKAAKYEYLLFSDADCYPVSSKWISSISRNFSKETELILGVGKYERKGGLLNLLVRYETFTTAVQYIAAALRKKAYMGVGRNMAYKKELFFRHKGFASHLKVLSGDDDLFVNEATTKSNTVAELSPDSFTLSSPPENFRRWFKQKKRHLSTSSYYKRSSRLRLGIEYISRILYYISLVLLLCYDYWFWTALASLTLLSVLRLIIVKLAMNKLKERDLLLPSLLLDPLMPLILAIIQISNIIRPQKAKWN